MDLSPRAVARGVVRRANRFGATPFSPRSVLNDAGSRLGLRESSLHAAVAGKVVLVTGASSGIGRAAAVRFAGAGAVVLLVARSEDLLAEVAAEIGAAGGTAYSYRCDLTDYDQIDALVTKVLDAHGHVDILVNNAGMSIRRKVRHSVDRFHDFERPMQLNYFAAIRLTMGLLPTMVERESGQIINISSWAALLRPARFSGYSASKAALEAWSDSVQGEVLDDGIVFTNVHMPLVRTPMITPTKLYSRMPALSMEEAGEVVCGAAVSRSRRVTPLVASMAGWVESISPGLGDVLRKNAI